MQCPRCQQDNPPQAKFCLECATPLARSCSNCGTPLPGAAKFCMECAQPAAATAPPSPRFGPPDSYTPSHLAERILTSKSALEGERKQVTVLFADLKGSMELLADRDPDEARRLLDPVLARMMEAVHRYEGTVNQVMGDGIMALFGAPLAHEDHAVRACYAALAMQASVGRYADELRQAEGVDVQVRVGLNSGEVVVRTIGSDLKMDYSAVGQTVHLAARMEQLARPGTILVAADSLRLAEGYVEVRPLGPVPVKGLSGPVDVYELHGAGAARSRLQAAAARGLTRFVGREAELETLRRTSEQAGAGQGQLVALVGEPGVGKSRLVWEFSHSHRTQGWLVLESGSVSYGKATSYLPVIDLLKSYCGIERRDDPRRMREKLTGKLLTLDPALQLTLPALLALLDLPVDDPAWAGLDPSQRKQRTLEALKRLLLRESQEQPVLLIFEDLHWIDAETQALLESLVDSLPTARLLLLVNYRPEYQHAWSGKSYYAQLRLDSLPPESAEELLGALLGDDPTLPSVKRRLIEHTQGNPFFLEETVRALVETKALIGERGAYRRAADITTLQVAPTVQAVLAARIDRLPPEDKRLLQTAAVIGKDLPFALLEAITDGTVGAQGLALLQAGLARLQAAEFLYERSLFPELELTFKHALTHEVAYGSLLHERRRVLHARIVNAIESTAGDRLAEQVDRLAHHAVRGEVWPRAIHYLRQAYDRVMAHSAQREAAAYAQQALAALAHLPDGRDKIEQAIDLRFQLRHALWALGDFSRIREILVEAEQLADTLADDRRRGWVSLYMCGLLYGVAEHDRAVAEGERALALATALKDEPLRALALVNLGQAHVARTDYEPALELSSRAVSLLGGDLLHNRLGQGTVPSVLARVVLVRGLVELGRFTDGRAVANEAVRIAEEVDHPGSLALAYKVAGLPYVRRGDFARAIPLFERGLGICRELDLPTYAHWIAPPLGSAYALTERAAEAVALLEQALEHGATANILSQQSLTLVYLGEALLLAGRDRDALERATEALRLARARNERGYQAWALRLLGEIATRQDPSDNRADLSYHEALRIADDLGMRPLAAHCHLGLGRLHQRTGEGEPALEHLTTATAMYRDMEMTFWLAQAEAELANPRGTHSQEQIG